MNLKRQCANCEFNFGGTCVGGDNGTHPYGATIENEEDVCDGWSVDRESFTAITRNAPWYIKEPYDSMRIDYITFEDLLEADDRGEAIAINIYDAIRHLYKISLVDLAVALGVSFNVIYRAKTHDTPEKRQVAFAKTLCMPQKFFAKITTHDFSELEKCAETFALQTDTVAIGSATPEWKEKIISEVSAYLRCPIHIAKEISRVDFLNWDVTIPLSEVSPSEKILIEFVQSQAKKKNKTLSRLEYSLDNGGHIRISALSQ